MGTYSLPLTDIRNNLILPQTQMHHDVTLTDIQSLTQMNKTNSINGVQ